MRRSVIVLAVVLGVAAPTAPWPGQGPGLSGSAAARAQELPHDQPASADSALPPQLPSGLNAELPSSLNAELPGGLNAEVPSGLSGRVVLASRCPVPLGADEGTTCPAVPLATTLAVRSADGGTELAQVASDADGQFWVPLAPGQYLLVIPAAATLPAPACTVPITVSASGPTTLNIHLHVQAAP